MTAWTNPGITPTWPTHHVPLTGWVPFVFDLDNVGCRFLLCKMRTKTGLFIWVMRVKQVMYFMCLA